MKAKHGETRSERKKHRSTLHEHEIYVSILRFMYRKNI